MHYASNSVIFTSLFQLFSIEKVTGVRSISACVYRCLYLADYFLVLCKQLITEHFVTYLHPLGWIFQRGSAQVLRFWAAITLVLFLAQEKRSVLVVFWILAFLTGNTLYLLYTFSSQQLYNRWAKPALCRLGAGDNWWGGKEGRPVLPHNVEMILKDLLSLLYLCNTFQCRKRVCVSPCHAPVTKGHKQCVTYTAYT